MTLEAKCGKCGETFNPLPEEVGGKDGLPGWKDGEAPHVQRVDGADCDGVGKLTGSF